MTLDVTSLGKAVVVALPPAFLVLLLIDIVFIVVIMWFLDVQLEQRMVMANKILDHCLASWPVKPN